MRIEQTKQQKIKIAIHAVQAFLVFITGCLALAVLTKSGGSSGTVGYMFGLCFLTIIPLIYQVMVPMWSRAWRFANVYAYASLDILFAILWFAAFVAVAAWNNSGKSSSSKSKSDSKSDKDNSSSWAHGSESKLHVSEASVGFGVILCLLFAMTSWLSLKAVFEYRRTGVMPNGSSKIHGRAEQLSDQDKDAWNVNIDEHDTAQEDGNPFNEVHADDRLGYGHVPQSVHEEQGFGLMRNDTTSNYSGVSRNESMSDAHPGRSLSYGSQTMAGAETSYDPTLAPSALSPTNYEPASGGRLSFPLQNYNEAFR